jgi:hypothetical protein
MLMNNSLHENGTELSRKELYRLLIGWFREIASQRKGEGKVFYRGRWLTPDDYKEGWRKRKKADRAKFVDILLCYIILFVLCVMYATSGWQLLYRILR